MSQNKDVKLLNRWVVLFISALVVGCLAILIDVSWIKKILYVILALIGFVASGSVYQLYENKLDELGKKNERK